MITSSVLGNTRGRVTFQKVDVAHRTNSRLLIFIVDERLLEIRTIRTEHLVTRGRGVILLVTSGDL